MFVTLEVSKLSGWLNADARCRASKVGHAMRGEVNGVGGQQVVNDRCARSVQGWTRLQFGGRAHGQERTNMWPMSVTLEVSTLSGWLNADALCRESEVGHAVRGAVYGSGGQKAVDDRGARSVQGRARL